MDAKEKSMHYKIGIILVLGFLLRFIPRHDPDSYFSFIMPMLILIFACAQTLGMLLLGKLIRNYFFPKNNEFALSFVLGSIAYCAMAVLLARSGLLTAGTYFLSPACSFLMILIYFNAHRFSFRSISNSFEFLRPAGKYRYLEWILVSSLVVLVLMRIIQAGFPIRHGDPLYYHLLAPRLWAQSGGDYFNFNLPIAYLASLWEYNYLYAMSFWFGENGKGLIEGQIHSQYLHLLWGVGGSLLVAGTIVKHLTNSRIIVLLAVVAVATTKSLQWSVPLAKNDWGIVFWTLSAAYLLLFLPSKHRKASAICGGLLAGAACMAKLTSAMTILPIFILGGVLRFRAYGLSAFKDLSIGVVIALLAMLPITLRNYLATSNPFFPLMNDFFPSVLATQSYLDFIMPHHSNTASLGGSYWLGRISELLKESPLIFILLLSPLLFFARDLIKDRIRFFGTIFIAVLSFILLATFLGSGLELRLLGPGLVMFVIFAVTVVWVFLKKLPEKIGLALAFLAVVGVLAGSRIPFHALTKLPKRPSGDQAILEHTGGVAKQWLRKNVKPGEHVVMMAENEAYYLSHLKLTVITERPDLDPIFRESESLIELVARVKNIEGMRYLLCSTHSGKFHKSYEKLLKSKPEAFVYTLGTSFILDLKRL